MHRYTLFATQTQYLLEEVNKTSFLHNVKIYRPSVSSSIKAADKIREFVITERKWCGVISI